MIVTLEENIKEPDIKALYSLLAELGFSATEVCTQSCRYLVAIGKKDIDIRRVGHAAGVRDVHRVSDAYKLVSRKWKVDPTAIMLQNGARIVEGELALIAGPCSIESEEQVRSVLQHLREQRIGIMRGGAFKPRTSPYSFRGMGLDGLKMWRALAKEHGIAIVTEVLAASQIKEMYDYVDIFQVGARNSQNFDLLDELGKIDKPVLLKRGMSGTLEELLQSAEYVFSKGNERLILCERGIRTFENAYRNTFDVNAVPVLKEKSHLPLIIDPSHGIGVRRWVEAVALAGIVAGADGIIYEVHPTPEKAMSDAQQTLDYAESAALVGNARTVFGVRG